MEICRPLLLKELDVSGKLVSILFQDGILSREQRDDILSKSKVGTRRKVFLATLQRCFYKRGSPFDRFLKSLDNSGQAELMKKLKNPEEGLKAYQNKKHDVELELKVQKCFVRLTENIDLKGTCLLELFMQEGIIDADDMYVLSSLPPTERARQFLCILECRKHHGKSPYYFFLEAIEKEGQGYLAKEIEDITITDEDIDEYKSKLISCLS